MEKELLAYEETSFFSGLIRDYLGGEDKLKPFYSFEINRLEDFEEVIAERGKQPLNRKVLSTQLEHQYSLVEEASPEALKNIELLKEGNTFTITTGHQLNLFTGPLFFVYKILDAIQLCRQLKKKFPEYNFVPLYWMASEDHDYKEISQARLYKEVVDWKKEKPSGAVGRLSTQDLGAAIEEVKHLLFEGERAGELIRLLENSYLRHNNLANATRFLVDRLFGKYGLVVLDGDDLELKRLFSPLVKEELLNKSSFAAVEKSSKILGEHYKTQVNPREINLFYLDNGYRGRIIADGEGFALQDRKTKFARQEMLEELEKNPARFSPNVVLRPVYQELILPNLAYIGGGGELAYWFQLGEVFKIHKVFFPALILRNSVLWIKDHHAKNLKKSGLKLLDLFKKKDALLNDYIRSHGGDILDFSKEQGMMEIAFSTLEDRVKEIDPSLVGSVLAERQRAMKGFANLEKKVLKAEKRKQETSLNQLIKLKESLFPEEELQERKDNFLPYYHKYGPAFFDYLLDLIDPMEKEFTIILDE